MSAADDKLLITPVRNQEFNSRLVQAIGQASGRIRIAAFEFNLLPSSDKEALARDLLKMLIEKKSQGMKIQLLLGIKLDASNEGMHYLKGSTLHACSILKKAGINVRVYGGTRESSHCKYVIADDRVILGSHNIANRSLALGQDESVLIEGPAGAASFNRLFNAQWKDATRSVPDNAIAFDAPMMTGTLFRGGLNSFRNTATKVDRSALEILFEEKYYARLIAELKKAKQSIKIKMFFFSFSKNPRSKIRKLLKVLTDARKKGRTVRVILDKDSEGDPYGSRFINLNVFKSLKAAGVEVTFDDPDVVTHGKMVLVDDDLVFVGSHNFTLGSFEDYSDLSILVRSSKLAHKYHAHFNSCFRELTEKAA